MRALRELAAIVAAGAALSTLGLVVSGHAEPRTLEALLDTVRRLPELVAWDDARVRASEPEALLVVDARAAGEYSAGHPVGAVSLPFPERHELLPELPSDRAIATVLVVGDRDRPGEARELARWLAHLWGLDRVALFTGGWQGWREAQLPEGAR